MVTIGCFGIDFNVNINDFLAFPFVGVRIPTPNPKQFQVDFGVKLSIYTCLSSNPSQVNFIGLTVKMIGALMGAIHVIKFAIHRVRVMIWALPFDST